MGASKFSIICFRITGRHRLITILLAFLIFIPSMVFSNSTMYGIQVYEYKDPKSAENRVNNLNQLGHDAFYRCEKTESGEMTCRVFVDQFETQAEAEEEATFLKKLDLIKDFTIYAIVDKPPPEKQKPTPPPPSPSKNASGAFQIHVGSFKIKTNADMLVNRLEKAGYKALMNYEMVNGKGYYYRVYISGYTSKGNAENAAQALKKSGIISSYTIKNSDERPSSATPKTTTIVQGKTFYLHIGSYQNLNNAEKMVQALQGQGQKAFFMTEELPDETWFRVYIGGFDNENAARKIGTEIQGKGLISYYKVIEIK